MQENKIGSWKMAFLSFCVLLVALVCAIIHTIIGAIIFIVWFAGSIIALLVAYIIFRFKERN